MQTNEQSSQSSKRTTNIIIGIGGLLLVCCTCLLIATLVYRTPTSSTTQTVPTSIPIETLIAGTLNAAPTSAASPVPPQIENSPTAVAIETNTLVPPPVSNIGIVGERKEAGGIALTVLGVSKTDSINEFLKPEVGNNYLVIEVLIENVNRSDDPPYNPLYFSVKDSDGFQYQSALFAPDPSLQSGTLTIGDKVRGFVAFEVKLTASGFVTTYEPLVILGGYEPIRINLGQ